MSKSIEKRIAAQSEGLSQAEVIIWHTGIEDPKPPLGEYLLLDTKKAWYKNNVEEYTREVVIGTGTLQGHSRIFYDKDGNSPQIIIAWAKMPTGWRNE